MTSATTPSANPIVRSVKAWDRFWFFPADPTLLGFLRICAGLITLYIHFAYTYDLQALLGKDAWVDLKTANAFRFERPWPYVPSGWEQAIPPGVEPEKGFPAWSLWYSVTDPTWMAIIHGCVLFVIFLFTIGLFTRITSVLTWLAALTYIQRSPTSLFGLDTMMNLVLLYLMIGPSGAALSADRLIARYRAARRALREVRPVPIMDVQPQVSARLALRLLQINLCVIYFVAGLSKLQGQTWWQFTAVWLTMANPEFSPLHTGPYVEFLRFLCHHRWLWELVMSVGVVFTFWVELGFPSMVWRPNMRWVMICSALAMHIGISMTMQLTTFSMMMAVMVLSFVPEETVRRLFRRRGNAEEMILRVDSRSRKQARLASLLYAVDAWSQVEIESTTPLSQAELIQGRRVVKGYAVFERLTRRLPLLWPVALLTYLPPVRNLGSKWYPPSESAEARPAASDAARRILQGERIAP